MRALTDVTSEILRKWRESRGWDVPRMARELRKAARDTGEDVAAHHGLVKMIPQWERGNRAPRERYRLLYLKVFQDMLGDLPPGMAFGTELAVRLAGVRSRAARLPGPDEIRALEIRQAMAELDVHVAEVEASVAALKALLADDEAAGEEEQARRG